jgi:hypothetical protein
MREIEKVTVYRQRENLNKGLGSGKRVSAKRICYSRLLPETENIKYPNNPVNPV